MKKFKLALFISAGVFLLLVAVVLVGGSLYPREHVARSSITVPTAIEEAWAEIRNPPRQTRWWDGLERVEQMEHPTGGEAWRYHMANGQIDLEVTRVEPPTLMVTRVLAAPDAPFGGTWTYNLEMTSEGTRVTITEAGYINSLMFRFVANAITGVHGTADRYLRGLAGHFGSDAEPVHVELGPPVD